MPQLYRCPLCQADLQLNGKRFICPSNHSFDIAKEGYVNLLPVQNKKSKEPGDNAQMVQSRRTFLNSGYYDNAINAIIDAALMCTDQEQVNIVDIGCGEGYYLERVSHKLNTGKVAGIDIAKPAVKLAAKKQKHADFCVGSAYDLPYRDTLFDLAISVFSPLNLDEVFRVLKPGGHVIIAGPAPEHLQSLAAHIYKQAQQHKGHGLDTHTHEGFAHILHNVFNETITVANQHILDLLTMTPYFWRSTDETKQALNALPKLDVELAFDIQTLQKKY